MDGGSAADASTRAGEQPCPHRTLLLLPFVLHSLHSVRGWAYPQPRLDVCWIGYVSSTYRNFVLFIFLPILHGYMSTAYPMRIHIGYVSNTGYAPSLAYRGNVAGPTPSVLLGPHFLSFRPKDESNEVQIADTTVMLASRRACKLICCRIPTLIDPDLMRY